MGTKGPFLTATDLENGKGLHVNLMRAGNGNYEMSSENVDFWCGPDKAQVLSGRNSLKQVFYIEMQARDNMTLISTGEGITAMGLSLRGCNFDDDEKNITCDFIWH